MRTRKVKCPSVTISQMCLISALVLAEWQRKWEGRRENKHTHTNGSGKNIFFDYVSLQTQGMCIIRKQPLKPFSVSASPEKSHFLNLPVVRLAQNLKLTIKEDKKHHFKGLFEGQALVWRLRLRLG